MRTTLDSGAWIGHVPVQELKGGHKRKLDRAGKPQLAPGSVDESGNVDIGVIVAGMDIASWSAAKKDALWALLIDDWSYEAPVPVLEADGTVTGADAFDEIPLADYEEIEQLFEPYAAKLNRRPDPKHSITSASNGSSPARAGGSRKG
jgi:hypothetical protein